MPVKIQVVLYFSVEVSVTTGLDYDLAYCLVINIEIEINSRLPWEFNVTKAKCH